MRDGNLRNLFKRFVPRVHFQPIEVGVLARGVPDMNYCGDGVEGWIELKATHKNRLGLRPEQIGWIVERMRNGGLVRVGMRYCDSMLMIYDGSVAPGSTHRALLDSEEYMLGCWEGGEHQWNWDQVREILLTRSHR